MKQNFIVITGLICLFACSRPAENDLEGKEVLITFNDFEAIDGWMELPASVNKERAHSGKYSVKVDKDNEFSFGFQKQLGQVTSQRPKAINLSAQVYVPARETGKASLVVSLTDPEKNEQVFYQEIKLAKVGSVRKWEKVTLTVPIQENAGFNNILKVYLWRGEASEPVYLDDLKLTAVY